MSDRITIRDYQAEINSLAEQVRAEAKEYDRDLSEVLWETIDSHQWVIYTAYAREVAAISRNADAIFDAEGKVENDNGMFDSRRAYYAMEADVNEALERLPDDEEENETGGGE